MVLELCVLMLTHQNKNNKKVRKSQILLLGSLLIFLGGISLSYNFIKSLKEDIFEEMKQLMVQDIPPTQNIDNNIPITEQTENNSGSNNVGRTENFDKYLGILEIPKIGLKKGFYNVDSRYNSIQYNVTVIQGSTFPDVAGGNLMLMAHSGTAYISYFRYLYNDDTKQTVYIAELVQ